MKSFAVILTSHNRREKTLAAIAAFRRSQVSEAQFNVFLNDDGSNDGTVDSVKRDFPEVQVCSGSGDDFWAGGMVRVFNEFGAMILASDYVVLANDDIGLAERWDHQLIEFVSNRQTRDFGAAVGLFLDDNKRPSYGLRTVDVNWLRSRFSDLISNLDFEDTPRLLAMNGNFVVIPSDVVRAVGFLDDNYRHGFADHDYSLVIQAAGFRVMYLPFVVGRCNPKSMEGTFRDPNLSYKERARIYRSPKNPGLREKVYFYLKNFGKVPLITVTLELLKIVSLRSWLIMHDLLRHRNPSKAKTRLS